MATQRRKRAPKKVAPKRTIWRKLFWLGFKLSLVVAAFMVVFGIYLDTKVRERFDGEKWQLPVMVYSRPLELYPSQRLSRDQMLRELNMLSYKQVRQPHTPGEYAVSGNRIDLACRALLASPLDGKTVRMDSPVTAIQLGLGLCPEDRKAEGIIAELSVRENIVLALQARQGLWPAIGRVQQTTLAEGYVKALGIKTADVDTPIGQLSGGNQQKAVLARWLATQPSLLILDEPTRGIDIAAKQEIMNEILALAKQGMAVLFISSEMEEVVRVSDRIVVLRDRAKVGELPAGTNDQAVYAMIAGQA